MYSPSSQQSQSQGLPLGQRRLMESKQEDLKTDYKGKLIDKDPSMILQDQYMSVLTTPLPDKIVRNPKEFFEEHTEDKPKLKEATINKVKIRAAIMKTKSGAVPGPDGISIDFVKIFVDELLDPLEIIYQNSVDEAIFPAIWKISHITPAKKPGKNKSKAESFCISMFEVWSKL